MQKWLKTPLFIVIILLNLPLISYATCKAKISNLSNESLIIGFIPDSTAGSDEGNVYFKNLSPSQCPGSTIDHGIPKNGPCTIPAKGSVDIDYTSSANTISGTGFLATNSIGGGFVYNNSKADTCTDLKWNGAALTNIQFNSENGGDITVSE